MILNQHCVHLYTVFCVLFKLSIILFDSNKHHNGFSMCLKGVFYKAFKRVIMFLQCILSTNIGLLLMFKYERKYMEAKYTIIILRKIRHNLTRIPNELGPTSRWNKRLFSRE